MEQIVHVSTVYTGQRHRSEWGTDHMLLESRGLDRAARLGTALLEPPAAEVCNCAGQVFLRRRQSRHVTEDSPPQGALLKPGLGCESADPFLRFSSRPGACRWSSRTGSLMLPFERRLSSASFSFRSLCFSPRPS